MKTRTAKDWIVFLILLAIGIFYLVLQIISIVQNGFVLFRTQGNDIVVGKEELLYEFRSYLTILLCLTGAALYIAQKRSGWVIAVAILGLYLTIASGGIATLIQLSMMDAGSILVFGIVLILAILVLSLWFPSTIRRFGIRKWDKIKAGLLTGVLLLVYFVL